VWVTVTVEGYKVLVSKFKLFISNKECQKRDNRSMKQKNERSYSPEFWERLQLFKDCIAMKKPKRIPLLSCFYTWKILDSDSGYKLSEAMANYDVMERVVCEFHERYQFDAYNELGTRNMVKPFDDLGSRTIS